MQLLWFWFKVLFSLAPMSTVIIPQIRDKEGIGVGLTHESSALVKPLCGIGFGLCASSCFQNN